MRDADREVEADEVGDEVSVEEGVGVGRGSPCDVDDMVTGYQTKRREREEGATCN